MNNVKTIQLGLLVIGVLLLIAATCLYLSGFERELPVLLALAGAVCGFGSGGLGLANARRQKSQIGWDNPDKDPLTTHIDGR